MNPKKGQSFFWRLPSLNRREAAPLYKSGREAIPDFVNFCFSPPRLTPKSCTAYTSRFRIPLPAFPPAPRRSPSAKYRPARSSSADTAHRIRRARSPSAEGNAVRVQIQRAGFIVGDHRVFRRVGTEYSRTCPPHHRNRFRFAPKIPRPAHAPARRSSSFAACQRSKTQARSSPTHTAPAARFSFSPAASPGARHKRQTSK